MAKVSMTRDPAGVAAALPRVPGRTLVLGLDLGTAMGYCATWYRPGDPVVPATMTVVAGQVDLSAGPYDSGAVRFVRLRHFLAAVRPDLVVYEMVRNTPAGAVTRFNAAALLARAMTSAQLFGAFQSHVCSWGEEAGVPVTSVSIGEIKKRATGRGSADKPAVIAAANRLFDLGLDVEGYETSGADNVADAAVACLLAVERYGAGLPTQPPEGGQP